MRKSALLIDLDQTLVDSRPIQPYRQSGQWSQVFSHLRDVNPYPGIPEWMEELAEFEIPVCIVTSSPRSICHRLIHRFGWTITATVCRHDTRRLKPHPDPLWLGLNHLGVSAEQALWVGDSVEDIQAGKAARIQTVGALWGAVDPQALQEANPDNLFESLELLREWLAKPEKKRIHFTNSAPRC